MLCLTFSRVQCACMGNIPYSASPPLLPILWWERRILRSNCKQLLTVWAAQQIWPICLQHFVYRLMWHMASHLNLGGQVTDVARNCQALCLLGTVYVAATALRGRGQYTVQGCLCTLEEGDGFMVWFCAARMTGSSASMFEDNCR